MFENIAKKDVPGFLYEDAKWIILIDDSNCKLEEEDCNFVIRYEIHPSPFLPLFWQQTLYHTHSCSIKYVDIEKRHHQINCLHVQKINCSGIITSSKLLLFFENVYL